MDALLGHMNSVPGVLGLMIVFIGGLAFYDLVIKKNSD